MKDSKATVPSILIPPRVPGDALDLQGVLLCKSPVTIFVAYPACPVYRDCLYCYIGHILHEQCLETISKFAQAVTPAKARVQENPRKLDSRLRGNDDQRSVRHFEIAS